MRETSAKALRDTIAEECTACGACREECAFLQRHGLPGEIAGRFDPDDRDMQTMPYECSLCGLCSAVCPVSIEPARLFLELRREVSARGLRLPDHQAIKAYEKAGTSRRFTYYGLPEGCKTVFFPGCAIPGTRPRRVEDVYRYLKKSEASLGIVLDCCTKPSRDLGYQEYFEAMFGEMRNYLKGQGVDTILVACPNCYRVFKEHGEGLAVRTVYEVMAENGMLPTELVSGSVTVHDPCAVRFEAPIHRAARALIAGQGLSIDEPAHAGHSTVCCGEGGSVGFVDAELAGRWADVRRREAGGKPIATYCAGCANRLGKESRTVHLLDLAFEPRAAMEGTVSVTKGPPTYLNRLLLKRRLRKNVQAAATRERTFAASEAGAGAASGVSKPLLLLGFIALAAALFYGTGAAKSFDQQAISAWLAQYSGAAPFLYMALYAVAPSLFLPGLPITIAGGILFGPFWGVVYTIIGSTVGACLAFLVSRYFARDWVASRLRSPRWRRLDEAVARDGWKVVAMTRLIPLFPFNLLNYAFGLTKIPFLHYAAATFVCMLPACIAFIVFSSSLLDLIRGEVSPVLFAGIALVVAVSLIPAFYRKLSARKEETKTS